MTWFLAIWSILTVVSASLIVHRQSRFVKAAKLHAVKAWGKVGDLEDTLAGQQAAFDKKLKAVTRDLNDKLHAKDKRVQKIVDELSHVQWKRGPGSVSGAEGYYVTVSVCPRLFGGRDHDREDLIHIASYIGDQVAHDLATHKYVQKANDYEYGPRYGR